MTLNLSMPGQEDLKPRITVFGVGGAGGNAVNNMIEKELDGVDFVVANTDAQALQQAKSENRVQLGIKVTEGLGAGARASVGAAAAEESIEQIVDHLAGAHMCFITAGMGGGTGTGAAPIIAQAARELGVLTVGVVTKPFQFEGAKRMRQAEDGVEALQKVVDTLIIIPNQNLFRLANEKTTFTEAFSLADDVLYQGVKGVTDLMVRPGLINLDFADVRAVMDEMGKAMMGTGEAEGEDRAIQAAEKAIANPLLDEISLRGAKGVLINITGGDDLTLFELDEAANRIREEVDPEANIIVGSTMDDKLGGMMRVSVVATGIDATDVNTEMPVPRRSMSQPLRQQTRVEEAAEVAPAATVAAVTEVAEEQTTLFEDRDVQRVAAQEQAEDLFEDEGAAADDLPPPAYQPQVAAFEPRFEDELEAEPEAYVAPRAPAPGTPSPEALARLRAAAQKANPEQQQQQQQRPVAAAPAGGQAGGDKPRFGINSLINRMTGHADGEAAPRPTRQQPPVQQQQPRVAAAPQPAQEQDPDQERIEIPAFLRRQAN
ncbi:cell division protein FtsZ [Sulfitobacter sp. M57]|uniref:cell division protein FtsZ n=1 Tax=unclassified Sulfitobacter TaxID=196795 RepID=UPI0023E2D2EB|nr:MULTISPECIES: cell division protein FtsZ [unclassified Sulfitobacter]MDF3414115.1 cell division protein FtsZ [Sulfitobacter sp. KE5]MDF3420604.1 cell division protein FtsZ [Sulfitobacter sp. KE43]MDF3432661.1 cell division protein FtsZ [Sulfitobacter sp. KE42]MDF3458300.1 cell division protein FtsZ [Sulfitobacter sp. S74]MDF3462201.1 cell division protein FtsZ [Sulfitobacter sp. Ks18]